VSRDVSPGRYKNRTAESALKTDGFSTGNGLVKRGICSLSSRPTPHVTQTCGQVTETPWSSAGICPDASPIRLAPIVVDRAPLRGRHAGRTDALPLPPRGSSAAARAGPITGAPKYAPCARLVFHSSGFRLTAVEVDRRGVGTCDHGERLGLYRGAADRGRPLRGGRGQIDAGGAPFPRCSKRKDERNLKPRRPQG
jgi:hypothetical protein